MTIQPHSIAPFSQTQLEIPNPSDPSIPLLRVVNPDVSISAFGDMTWELSALQRAGERRCRINWNSWPEPFVDIGKHTAYALIRYGLPETFIDSRPRQKFGSIPTHPAPLTIYRHIDLIRNVAEWWMHEWQIGRAHV